VDSTVEQEKIFQAGKGLLLRGGQLQCVVQQMSNFSLSRALSLSLSQLIQNGGLWDVFCFPLLFNPIAKKCGGCFFFSFFLVVQTDLIL